MKIFFYHSTRLSLSCLLLFLFLATGAEKPCVEKSPCPPLQCNTAQTCASHTFLSIPARAHFDAPESVSFRHNGIFKHAFNSEAIEGQSDLSHGFSVNIYNRKSTNSAHLASYFMPFNKTIITAGEFTSDLVLNNNHDVLAHIFGVFTDTPVLNNMLNEGKLTFESTLTMKPEHSCFGITFQSMHHFLKNDEKSLWLYILIPLQRVKNEVHFSEQVINSGGNNVPKGYVGTVTAALRGKPVFGGKTFRYGKIGCDTTKSGIADIQILLGSQVVNTNHCFLNYTIGATFPTGTTPCAEFIFEPIIGNNHHFAAHGGFYSGFQLTSSIHSSLWFITETLLTYSFKNSQLRSLDLINKDWSRYMWVYPTKDAVPFNDIAPGINFLTQNVHVRPGFCQTSNLYLMFNHKQTSLSLGYSAHIRQTERISLAHPWQEGVGLVGFNRLDISNNGIALTQSKSSPNIFVPDLNDRNSGEFIFKPIKENELNLASAATPGALIHTLSGSLHVICGAQSNGLWSLGGSYEFCKEVGSVNRWSIWTGITCGI